MCSTYNRMIYLSHAQHRILLLFLVNVNLHCTSVRHVTRRYLYKYIESEKHEMMKDRADPTVLRSALTVRCRSARRSAYFIWNSFSVTVSKCTRDL